MSSAAQRHMLHLAVAPQTALVRRINSLFGFGLFVGFVDNNKKD